MNTNRWFMIGAFILLASALAVAWTTVQRHAYADSNQNQSQVSDVGVGKDQAPKSGTQLPSANWERDLGTEDVKIDVSLPQVQVEEAGSSLTLPDVPSLSERKLPSADSLRDDPVFDELRKMFNESHKTEADLTDSAGSLDTSGSATGSGESTSYIEALDRRMEVVELLAKSSRGMIREAYSLCQQGKSKQASQMLSLATLTRETMLRLLTDLSK